MSRRSSIDELPDEVRAEIGRLLTQGATIDGIVEHLRTLHGAAPSRSAVGRHVQKMAKVGEKLRRSRDVSEALVRELGDAGPSKVTQLNIELLQGTILDLFNSTEDDMAEVDGDGKAALAGNPEGVMMLAKALDHLGKASKSDLDYRVQIETRATEKAKRAAATAAETVGRERGLSADTLAAIKGGILGVERRA